MEQNVLSKRENFNAVDVAKFLLAFCVISIHTCYNFFENSIANAIVGSVIIRLAVPFFFVASGFFFFRDIIFENGRIKKCPENRAKLFSFLKRIFLLYLIWAVIYFIWEFFSYLDFGLPVSALLKGYFASFFLVGFAPPFWYLLFMMYAIMVLYVLLRFLRIEFVGIIVSILFIFFLWGHTYRLAFNSDFLNSLITRMFYVPIPVINNFFHLLLFYIALTFLFSGLACTYLRDKISLRTSGFLALLSLCLLLAENICICILVSELPFSVSPSYTLFLVPIAIFGFIFLSKIKLNGKDKIFALFRKGSSFIYCSHVLIMMIFNHFTNRQFVDKPILFFIISALSLVATLIIVPLSGKLKFLKRLY